MKYLWSEDSTSGYDFWNLVNNFYFHNEFKVEKSYGNSDIIGKFEYFNANDKEKITNNMHYVILDTVPDNARVLAKLEKMESIIQEYPNNIKMVNIICFEYLILAAEITFSFIPIKEKKLYQIFKNILDNTVDFSINHSSLNKNSLTYIQSLPKQSTENIYKNSAFQLLCYPGWSINTNLGYCWYKDYCEDIIVSREVQLDKITNSEKFKNATSEIKEKMRANIKKNLTECLISNSLMKGTEKLEQLLSCNIFRSVLDQLKIPTSSDEFETAHENARKVNVF